LRAYYDEIVQTWHLTPEKHGPMLLGHDYGMPPEAALLRINEIMEEEL
jgi:hypothetical protein